MNTKKSFLIGGLAALALAGCGSPLQIEPAADVHAAVDPAVQERFEELADRWVRDTEFLSVHTKAILHRAYQQIISLGPRVVPLLLQRLRDQPDHWFWALEILTDENPAADANSYDEARNAWLSWGRAQGLIS